MNFWQFLTNLFQKKTEKKTEDNPFYNVRAEHEQIARQLDEWRKREIMRSLQAPKSAEEFKREIGAETFQGENYFKQKMFINSQIVQQTEAMKIIYDSEGNAHYFPKHAHNCRIFKIIRNQNESGD